MNLIEVKLFSRCVLGSPAQPDYAKLMLFVRDPVLAGMRRAAVEAAGAVAGLSGNQKRMRIILIRHYKTLFNVSKQLTGWRDSPHAKDWVEDLVFVEAALQHHVNGVDAIYSSALERSRRTAEFFAQRLILPAAAVAPELNEVNYGLLSEKPMKWVVQHYPQHKRDPGFVYPDGESYAQLQARSVAFVQSLSDSLAHETVLCVIHAGVVRALVSHFLGLNYAAQLNRKVSHRYIGVLSFDRGDCIGYEEWGVPSGFVSDLEVALPKYCKRG